VNEYVPSTRARIYNLVQAYSKRKELRVEKVWTKLYERFESDTNKRWRQMANWNGETVLDTIHSLGKLEALLTCAREVLLTSEMTIKDRGHQEVKRG